MTERATHLFFARHGIGCQHEIGGYLPCPYRYRLGVLVVQREVDFATTSMRGLIPMHLSQEFVDVDL